MQMKSLLKKYETKHPKYWYVSSKGFVESGLNAKPKKTENRKKFGNYFTTRSKAELALERINGVFKRLKTLQRFKKRSKCCGAEVEEIHEDEGTSYYACKKCFKACDLK